MGMSLRQMRSTRRLLALSIGGYLALAMGYAQDTSSGLKNFSFEFALIGDQPYSPADLVPPAEGFPAGTKRQSYPSPAYERLIADLNANKKLEFVTHVGDIKEGNSLCEDIVYQKNLEYFNTYEAPVVYIPGDNEWTDCHRPTNGGYNPVARLVYLRSVFFTSDQSLGKRTITLSRQANYPENVTWTVGVVLFVGINQPGSNNNRNRTTGPFLDADAEYTARNTANLAWLNAAFDQAASDSTIKGVVIMQQANPFERFLEVVTPAYTVSGYSDFVSLLRSRTVALGKPVVLANGDTHFFRVDKPLTSTFPACAGATPPCVPVTVGGNRIMNFTRTEVFGQTDVHWTKVTVDPKDPNLFSFSPQAVPGN